MTDQADELASEERVETPVPGDEIEDHRNRHWFDRLMMLSDGVFAIAATLLSLDVRGPAQWRTLSELWAGLAPALNAYALSFLVIAVFWLAHRRFMADVQKVDAPLTVLTLIMLGLVGLVPGITHVSIAQSYQNGAMTLYAGLIVVIGWAMAAIWGYAALIAGLVTPGIPKSARWFQLVLIIFTAPLFLVLTNLVPLSRDEIGWAPVILALLFLVGWRLRLLVLKRLTQ